MYSIIASRIIVFISSLKDVFPNISVFVKLGKVLKILGHQFRQGLS